MTLLYVFHFSIKVKDIMGVFPLEIKENNPSTYGILVKIWKILKLENYLDPSIYKFRDKTKLCEEISNFIDCSTKKEKEKINVGKLVTFESKVIDVDIINAYHHV